MCCTAGNEELGDEGAMRIKALLERNVNIHMESCMRTSERSVEEDGIGTKGMN